MSGPESTLWSYLDKGMRRLAPDFVWCGQRIEDKLCLGVPDVAFSIKGDTRRLHGWIELKVIQAPPKREKTPFSIPHLTGPQRIWAARHGAIGGNVWLLLRVERPRRHLLFVPAAVKGLGTWTWAQTLAKATRVWADLDFPELAQILLHIPKENRI